MEYFYELTPLGAKIVESNFNTKEKTRLRRALKNKEYKKLTSSIFATVKSVKDFYEKPNPFRTQKERG